MLRSSGFDDKLYVNDKALCVVGDRIDLVGHRQRARGRYAHRSVRLSVEAPEAAPRSAAARRAHPDKRKTFKVNVKELGDLSACSQQLRRIYETVEVRDFERILRGLYVSDERRDDRRQPSRARGVLARVRPAEVYERFFGRHYAYLAGLVNKS